MYDVHSRAAEISSCKAFRYTLTRELSAAPINTALFALLNPSTANASEDDPTCIRCMGFGWSWGYERVVLVNTNPYRSTDPHDVVIPDEAVLTVNDEYVRVAATNADLIVCAWGANVDIELADRTVNVLRSVGKRLHHMGLTKGGQPTHPLYLHSRTKPKPWELAA